MRHARLLALLCAPLLLTGCETLDSMVPDMNFGDVGLSSVGIGTPSSQPAKTTGLAVADEPFAAKAGAAILAQGGSAADAVGAMFFVLSATYPVSAGLGGGGVCLVRDAGGRAREFDFLSHAANSGGAFAVPGAVAGFYDMQKAYGALPWQRIVAPGEAYAATGFPISHVLAQRLTAAQSVVRGDPLLAGEFLNASGQPKPEGTVVANPALSVTLGAIRLNGADGFYNGPAGQSIVSYSASIGAPITQGELSAYRSAQTAPRNANMGALTALVPGPSTGAGAFAASVLAGIGGGNSQTTTVAAVRKALDGFNVQAVPADLGATGFAALDANGGAAACAMTMNGPFGAGKSAADAGVTLAASPAATAGISSAFLTPAIGVDRDGQVVLSGAGAGGPNGTGAIVYALLRLATGQSLARPGELLSTGLAPMATVNVITCQNSLCVGLPDPGGAGLGARADDPPAVASN